MVSPYSFVLTPYNNQRYANTSRYGDQTLIKSTSQEDHTATNRLAVVKSIPLCVELTADIQPGDVVVVHHNIFRKYYDMQGEEKSGPCHFKDNLYIVDCDQVYLHKKEDAWNSVGDWCFIEPVEKEEEALLSLEKNQELKGRVVYSNKPLRELGVKEGEMVSFLPESEYEFDIDGQLLYKMRTLDICALI